MFQQNRNFPSKFFQDRKLQGNQLTKRLATRSRSRPEINSTIQNFVRFIYENAQDLHVVF